MRIEADTSWGRGIAGSPESIYIAVIIIYIITNNTHPSPSPDPRRFQSGFDAFNTAAAPVNAVGVLVVILDVFGIVFDNSGVTLLMNGGDIEVCKDVGVKRGLMLGVMDDVVGGLGVDGEGFVDFGGGGAGVGAEAGIVSRTDNSWLNWLGFNTPGFEDGPGAGGGEGGVEI